MSVSDPEKNDSSSGLGIVGVLILTAVIGVVVLALTHEFSAEFRAEADLDRRVSELAIFQYVQRVMDCS